MIDLLNERERLQKEESEVLRKANGEAEDADPVFVAKELQH
jgi:hypothetical protein